MTQLLDGKIQQDKFRDLTLQLIDYIFSKKYFSFMPTFLQCPLSAISVRASVSCLYRVYVFPIINCKYWGFKRFQIIAGAKVIHCFKILVYFCPILLPLLKIRNLVINYLYIMRLTFNLFTFMLNYEILRYWTQRKLYTIWTQNKSFIGLLPSTCNEVLKRID